MANLSPEAKYAIAAFRRKVMEEPPSPDSEYFLQRGLALYHKATEILKQHGFAFEESVLKIRGFGFERQSFLRTHEVTAGEFGVCLWLQESPGDKDLHDPFLEIQIRPSSDHQKNDCLPLFSILNPPDEPFRCNFGNLTEEDSLTALDNILDFLAEKLSSN